MRKLIIDTMAIGLRRIETNLYAVIYHLGDEDEAQIGTLYQGKKDLWRAMHADTGVSFGGNTQPIAAGRMASYHRTRMAEQAAAAGRAEQPRPAGQLGQLSLF